MSCSSGWNTCYTCVTLVSPCTVEGIAQQDEFHVIQIDVVQQQLEHLLPRPVQVCLARIIVRCRGCFVRVPHVTQP
eukprot:9501473-Pyramimonas_sp.AAC.2